MSNHPIEQDELMAYLDGELEAARAAEAASHLKQCVECQKLAAQLQEVSQMLVAWQVEETEAELGDEATAVLNKERDREAPRSRGSHGMIASLGRRRLVWAGGLAAVALLLSAIFIGNLELHKEVAELAPSPSLGDTIREGQNAVKIPKKITPTQPGSGTLGTLLKDGESGQDEVSPEDQEASETASANAPMIIRTADLGVVVKEFERARSSVDEILRRHHGHVGELSVSNPTGAARSLSGTLRIPSNQLDAALSDLKALGRVDKESQGGEEVTQQYIDLEARLANAKHTEQRLIEIQATRTGKLSDVLAVEMQIGRVRGEIERMEAERKNMKNQVDFATLNLTVVEDYKADLKVGPPSTGTQFRNAAVDGLESVTHGIISLLLWLLSVGPTLLLWAAILFFPVRMAWRKIAVIARDRRHRA
jgi:hypothetical protein